MVLRFWPEQERLANRLLERTRALPFPGLDPGVLNRGSDVVVWIAPDEARWDSLTGGRAPEWGAGVAFPQRDLVILPGFSSSRTTPAELPRVLRHELAHIALQRELDPALVPRWFTEGYATWTAGQFDPSQGWQLRLALLLDRAPALDSVTLHWPLIEGEARLAYLLSASAVTYLHGLGTPETFQRFIRVWQAEGDIEPAMREVYRLSTPQFERLWRQHVRRRYGWLQVAAQGAFAWGILTIAVTALFVVRRRRDRRRLERLREEELPDEPAYWDPSQPPEASPEDPDVADEEETGGSPPTA